MSSANSRVGLLQALEAEELKPDIPIITQCSTTATNTTENAIYLVPEVGETVETTSTPAGPVTSFVLHNQKSPAKVTPLARRPLRGNVTGVHLRPASTTIPSAGSGVIKIAAQPIMKSCVYHVYPAAVTNGFRIGNPTLLVPTTITTVTSTPVQSFIITTPTKPVQCGVLLQIWYGQVTKNDNKFGLSRKAFSLSDQNLQGSVGQLAINPKITCFECGRHTANAATCDNCGKTQPENPALPSGSVGSPTEKTPLPGLAGQKKRFYGKQLTPLVTLPNANGNVIKRTIVRRTAKRKSIDPPECLTISDDEEAMDSTNDTTLPDANDTSQEDESEPPTPEVDGNSQLNGLPNGKVTLGTRNVGQVVPWNSMNSTVELTCCSVRVGSHKVTAIPQVIFRGQVLFMTIPRVRNTGALAEIAIARSDIVRVYCHFGPPNGPKCTQYPPMLVLYTTTGLAASIRQQLVMTSKEGPYYDPLSEDETQKRIILIASSLNEKQRDKIKALYRDPSISGKPFVDKEDASSYLFVELTGEDADTLLKKSSDRQVIEQFNKDFPVKTTTSYKSSLYREAARSPVIIPLNKIKATTEVTNMITFPPPPVTGGITVTTEDFNCLESGEFFNDVIIDFYLKYMMLEKLSEEDKNRTHIFSSFFYGRLTNNEMRSHSPSSSHESDSTKGTPIPLGARRHNRVKTWTRHVDIFSKDFIIIPINENSHWFLAIICYPYSYEPGHEPAASKAPMTAETAEAKKKCLNSENTNAAESKVSNTGDVKRRKTMGFPKKRPCILVFDSLHGRNWSKITGVLREYLTCEWKSKKNSDRLFTRYSIKGSCPAVPQQSNYHDCGAFLLQYVDSFFETPIKDFSLPMRHLQSWFSQEVVDNKRQDLKDLILRLQSQQNGTARTDAGAAPAEAASSGSSPVSVLPTNSPLVAGCGEPTSKSVSNCLEDLASNYACDSPAMPSPLVNTSDSLASQDKCSDAATSDAASAGGLDTAADREGDFPSDSSSGVSDAAIHR